MSGGRRLESCRLDQSSSTKWQLPLEERCNIVNLGTGLAQIPGAEGDGIPFSIFRFNYFDSCGGRGRLQGHGHERCTGGAHEQEECDCVRC